MEHLRQLYETKVDLMQQYLIKRGATHEDAEEIVHNTFVKAIEYEVHLLEHGSAWLFKVALNQFYDLCRKQQRHPTVIVDEAVLYTELREAGVEEILLQKELGVTLKQELMGLSETYQNLLLLKYELGLSYEEIGKFLGMKPETVKTYLYRARTTFKEKWRQKYER